MSTWSPAAMDQAAPKRSRPAIRILIENARIPSFGFGSRRGGSSACATPLDDGG